MGRRAAGVGRHPSSVPGERAPAVSPQPRAGSVDDYRRVVGELRDLDVFRFQRLLVAEQYFRLYRLIEGWLRPGSRVLDWGCGTGHVSYFLLDRGFSVEAFSIEPAQLSEPLSARFPERFRFTLDPDAIRSLPYGDGCFDAVLSIGVLEHVRETGGDEAESLREIVRVLRPGGVFLGFHLPNRYSWIDLAARAVSERTHRHDFRYTRPEIERLMAAAGLELRECRRYALLPRLPWQRVPSLLSNSRVLASAYGALDAATSATLPWICQNYCFVAVRPRAGR